MPGRSKSKPAQRRVLNHLDAILALIENGSTVLAALKSRPEFPSYPTFSEVLKARPDVASRYREASRRRQRGPNARSRGADYSREELLEAANQIGGLDGKIKTKINGGPHWETLRVRIDRDSAVREAVKCSLDLRTKARLAKRVVVEKRAYQTGLLQRGLLQIEAYRLAVTSLPRGLEPHVRDDVATEIVIAVLSGDLELQDVATDAKDYIREHFYHFSPHAFTSLDLVNWNGEDGSTFLDNITADEWVAA